MVPTRGSAKFDDIYQLIREDLPGDMPGGAIIYCATRRHSEEVAQFLQEKGVAADFFHAGLPPETKKHVQESFIRGDLQAIAATNAFGMGIDKPMCGWWSTPTSPAHWRTTYRRREGRAATRRPPGAFCSTPRTTWNVNSGCRPAPG